MRTTNILTGGTIVGLLGLTGVLMMPANQSRATPTAMQETPPDRISMTGKLRDFPPNDVHPDFQVNPSATPGARSANNVKQSLDADMKPQLNVVNGVRQGKRVNQEWRDAQGRKIAWCIYSAAFDGTSNGGSFTSGANGNDNGGIQDETTFSQWFRDTPGVNMSRLWTIHLDRNSNGNYVYDTNNFNPIDHQLFGNGFDEQNFYFTYEIVVSFTAAAGQFVEFQGDDDFWMYIVGPGYPQGKLLIDHGGVAANREQRVTLDRLLPSNGGSFMVDQEYTLHMFFAERRQPQSQFRLETNISSLQTANDNSIFAAFD